jgi:hypothetical protein
MKLGRFVGPIALLVVLALFLFSFYGFKDQSSPPSRNSAPGPDRVKIHDIVYLWTDPGSKEFVDDFNALLRQEKDKPNKNYAVDYLQPKGMSFLRFFLRGVLENCDWFNRVWIIRPNSRIPIPAFANASHPQRTCNNMFVISNILIARQNCRKSSKQAVNLSFNTLLVTLP